MSKAGRTGEQRANAFLFDRAPDGAAGYSRARAGRRLAALESRALFALLGLACLFYILRLLASGGPAGLATTLSDGLWTLVLPALMLLAARFSFGGFTAACLLVYGGRAVADVVFSLTSALRTGGQVGLGSLLYMGLSGLILPLLVILLVGVGMQLVRLRWTGDVQLAAWTLVLTAAALLLGQLLQIWVAASLYSGGGGLSLALRYMWKNAAGDILRSGLLFLLLFLLDVFIRRGGPARLRIWVRARLRRT